MNQKPSQSRFVLRGPRIIAVAGNRGHLWGEQHRIETRTKRNHSRVNSEYLTLGGNYSRSPAAEFHECGLTLLGRRRESGAMTEDHAGRESSQRDAKHMMTHDFLSPD